MLGETSNGIRYATVGEGPVLFLVHGFPLDQTLWLDQMRSLSGKARLVTLDLRGFGTSPRMGSDILDMDTHAADCDLVLEELGIDTAHVVGLSMGGYVALAMADLFGHRVSSLVLMDTNASADGEAARRGRDATAERLVGEGRLAVVDALAGVVLGPEASVTARARFRTMAEATAYETYVGALMGMRDRPDRTGVLREFDGPVTVVSGADDALMPPADVAEPLSRVAPDSRLVLIPGAGHLPPLERPAATSAALAEHLDRVR